jgi:DNA-binding CsgD family transcriptional regulator
MRALSERDAAEVLAVTAELGALDEPDPFPPHFMGRLSRLIRCLQGCYCELDRGSRTRLRETIWSHGEEASFGYLADPDAPYWRLRHSHPVCGYRERSGDWTTAHMVVDFMSLADFRRTQIWDELYRDDHVTDWLDVGIRPTGLHTRMFLFVRTRGCFDDRDRLVLDLLQPHLQQRLDRVQAAADAVDALADFEAPADDDPGHVVLCSGQGVIEFASSASRRLLARYDVGASGRLPEPIAARLLRGESFVTAEREGRRLTLRAVRSAGLLVVLLGEEDVRLDRLTFRQRMVLEHVARGQTDAEIATELGIAPATVNKHLEQIYGRLGVHTRTAAAAIVK